MRGFTAITCESQTMKMTSRFGHHRMPPPSSATFPQPARVTRRAFGVIATLAVLLAGMNLAFAGAGLQIRNGTVAGGGAIASADDYVLISTLGEPAMGTIASGPFRLTSGFPATLGDEARTTPIDGPIFKDGFESTGSPSP
jgi:hypothetical protein